MHLSIHNAKQAKQFYQYKNTKIKLYNNNTGIWYNKKCRARQITLTYANMKMKSPLLTGVLCSFYRERRYQML